MNKFLLLNCSALVRLALGMGLSLSLGYACAQNTSRTADFIVAVVNSEPITNNEVQALKVRIEKQLPPGSPALNSAALTQQALEQLINEKAQLQLARENGVRIEDEAVDQAVQNVARQNQIEVPELLRRVVLEGLTATSFREQLRSQLMLSRLREREVENRVRVSDVEVDQFLQNQVGTVKTAEIQIDLNLAMILIAVPEASSEDQIAALQAKATDVAQRARAGESFATLALSFSQALDKGANGGEMGLRPADRYPSLFIESTASLRVGEIAGPVRSGAGFHVLKLLEKKQGEGSSTMMTQTRARHILLRIGPELSESAARNRLAIYQQRIQNGQADFAALATQYSQDGSAAAGGDLGWASPGQFVPEFEDAMARLGPGQVSSPLISRFGAHLIQVIERREVPLSAREQREMVRGQLRDKKNDEAFSTWAQEVRGRAYVELREPPQ
jgi:peptidyl-prolyl cis-trans isomerase SurA